MQLLRVICFVLIVASVLAQRVVHHTAASDGDRNCDNIRREITQLFQLIFERTIQPVRLQELLFSWNENFLPTICSKQTSFNRSLSNNNEGCLISGNDSRTNEENYLAQTEKRFARLMEEKHADSFLGNTRDTFYVSGGVTLPIEVSDFLVWSHYGLPPDLARQFRDYLQTKYFLGKVFNFLIWSHYGLTPDLARQFRDYLQTKYFLGKVFNFLIWSRYGLTPDLVMQFGDLMQMKYYLGLANHLKGRLIEQSEAPKSRTQSYRRDHLKFNMQVFQNSYPRKQQAKEIRPVMPDGAKIRKKRFLFGEAAEYTPMPSFFSIMMGTASDPNTGKRIEFGGDVMRNMIVNSYTSTLPFFAQPPPGKEPGELTKIMAPMWYFSNVQRALSPPTRLISKNNERNRNGQGYYGDTYSGKKRRRRWTSS